MTRKIYKTIHINEKTNKLCTKFYKNEITNHKSITAPLYGVTMNIMKYCRGLYELGRLVSNQPLLLFFNSALEEIGKKKLLQFSSYLIH